MSLVPTVSAVYLKSICFNIVIAVTTLASLPVCKRCNSNLEEINMVENSVSAAVPAPQQYMLGAK
jgi:hypothetical protein